jgi:hypothetical protein
MYGGIYVQSLVFSPVFIPRYLLFCSIPFFLAVAGALQFLIPYTRLQWAALVLIAASMLPWLQLNPSNHRDVKGLVAYVQSVRTSETPLIICPNYFDKTFAFHADLATFQDYAHFGAALTERRIYAVNGFNSIPPEILNTSPTVIFLDADSKFTYPGNGILEGLRTQFPHIEKQHFDEIFDVYVLKR